MMQHDPRTQRQKQGQACQPQKGEGEGEGEEESRGDWLRREIHRIEKQFSRFVHQLKALGATRLDNDLHGRRAAPVKASKGIHPTRACNGRASAAV